MLTPKPDMNSQHIANQIPAGVTCTLEKLRDLVAGNP